MGDGNQERPRNERDPRGDEQPDHAPKRHSRFVASAMTKSQRPVRELGRHEQSGAVERHPLVELVTAKRGRVGHAEPGDSPRHGGEAAERETDDEDKDGRAADREERRIGPTCGGGEPRCKQDRSASPDQRRARA